MNLLIIYALLVLILVGIGAVVILNFARYRYQGDLTFLFIALFILLFVATVILSFMFVNPSFLTLGGS